MLCPDCYHSGMLVSLNYKLYDDLIEERLITEIAEDTEMIKVLACRNCWGYIRKWKSKEWSV